MAHGDYTDLATLVNYLGIQGDTADASLSSAITAASRSIDNFCQRSFSLDTVATARTFVPDYLTELRLPTGDEIGSSTGLIVKTDPSGDGTYEVTWTASDFQLLPYNAPTSPPEPRPWTSLRAVGSKTFPWLINTWLTRLDRVQIVALWGWPEIPAPVTQACLIKASRLYHRRYSPQGIVGMGDMGGIRLSRGLDTDVIDLLHDYRGTGGVLVA